MLFRRPNFKSSVPLTDGMQTLMGFYGITPDKLHLSGTGALKEATVYICIKILAETLGKLPLKIYQKNNDNPQKIVNHYLYPMFKLRPNPYMSATNFWRCLETQRNLYGNAYVWIEYTSDGSITGFYPLDSKQMQIWVDDVGLISSKNSVWYIYQDNTGQPHKLMPTDLLHFMGLTTNGLIGINPIEAMRTSIENAKAEENFLNNSLQNGMSAKGIIHYVGDLDLKAQTTFAEKFMQMSGGLVNVNRVGMLPIGYTFQPLSMTMTDAQFLENTKYTCGQIAAAYGIKLHQLNDLTKTSYASTSEAEGEFYTDTLLANLKEYEDEINYKCFLTREIKKGIYSKFDANVILRADMKTRYMTYQIGINNGFLMPNEAREMEDKPAADGGDMLYGNGNLIPLTLAQQGINYNKKGGTNNANTNQE